MSNGSLHELLRAGELSWKKTFNMQTFLWMTTCNKNSDNFGLRILGARFVSKPKPIVVEGLYVTAGSLVPEYLFCNTVTGKSHVYSFGIVLLQVVWTRSVFHAVISGYHPEKPFEEEIDPNIKGNIAPKCWQVFIDIAQRCLENEVDQRPTMGEVEVELERALSLQEQEDITNTNGHYTLLSTTIMNAFSQIIWALGDQV
ncbi:hypothetical protein Fmac_017366 [Flemingia macrophylla]|uniref:Serine-threonine/tyrosine-protein kinase catalytic domain-containing protein n=1 Tax=Flemingia macrophylla TaxID=520843 RepID=A0ABD1M1Y0_9FABA